MKTKMTMEERREVLFPELSGKICELGREEQFAMEREAVAAVTMNVDGVQNVDDNNVWQTSSTVWSLMAKEYIDETERMLAFLPDLTTDIRVEGLVMENSSAYPTINVQVIDDAGTALVNPTDFWQSNLSSHGVPLTLNVISRPFALSSYDMMHDERISRYLGAAINAVGLGIMAQFNAALAAVAPSGTASVAPAGGKAGRIKLANGPADITPEYVARQLSPLFGERGIVDTLAVDPMAYAGLIPTSALSLDVTPGQYGIGNIRRVGGIATAGGAQNVTHALALRKNGVIMGAGTPVPYLWDARLNVRPIGSICGVPLVMTSSFDEQHRVYYNTVETLVGFKVATPENVYALTTKANSGSGSGSGSGSASGSASGSSSAA